jgi:tetratricopeptide (TPR) repeat protein
LWGNFLRYHVFLSYARKDNAPRRADGTGWVQLFERLLVAQYEAATGRALRVFLDEQRIENGEDWETRIQSALRQSRILIAILSPNYLASTICRMEIEDYIRHEQTATPGGEGVRPIYFATIPELEGGTAEGDDHARLIADLNRRNRDQGLNWCSWAADGVQALLRIEAEDRLAELHANPEPPLDRFVAGVEELGRKIAERLNDVALGELARGQGNLSASHVHFVGRSAEIAGIHRNLIDNQAQIVTALHGLGGQGKSALARQYAHAYASYYAAGGRWEVGCEGLANGLSEETRHDRCALLALAFDRLVDRMLIRDPGGDPRYAGLRLSPEQQRLPAQDRLQATLARLRQFTEAGWDERLAALRAQVGEVHGDWPAIHQPRMLVIFDNVDSAGLLNAEAYAALQSPDWLEMIVTTRLDPADVGAAGARASIAAMAVDHLPEGDSVELIRDMLHRAGNRPRLDEAERAAVRDLARALGGFTLAVELAGAYLATYPTVRIAAYLSRLAEDGIATVDSAATEGSRRGQVADIVRHREGQVGLILGQTLAGLPGPDVDVLHLASHFGPDHVVADWLRDAAGTLHPAFTESPEGREAPWDETLARLTGRRLLIGTERPGIFRLHRMVRDHLRRTAGEDRLARDREIAIRLAEAVGRASEAQGTGWAARPDLWSPVWPGFTALDETLLAEGAPDARLLQAYGVLAQRMNQHGSMNAAQPMIERHLDLAERLLAASPDSAEARRDLSVSQDKIGDFHLRRGAPGDADRALDAYEAALETRRKLAEDNPDSAEARRDLSISQNKIGDFLLRRGAPGDADRALAAYEAALETARKLAEDNPGSAEARRDLSVSQSNIGDVLIHRGAPGDADRALDAFEAALETHRKLAEDNPDSAEARRDLSISQNKIGDFLLRRGAPGDADRALAAYEAALETARKLAEDNPDSAEARRDLSVSQNKIGDFLLRRGAPGDADRALAAYEAALKTDLKLAEDNPGSAEARRDLSVSQNKIGDFHRRRGAPGDADRALAAYEAALETRRKLAEDNPDSAQARRDLSVSQERIGDVYLRRGAPGDADRALDAYEAALETRRKLAEDNPDSTQAQRDLSVSLVKLGQLKGQAGDTAAAQTYLREALAIIEGFAAEGRMMDPEMRGVRTWLREMFGLPPPEGEG